MKLKQLMLLLIVALPVNGYAISIEVVTKEHILSKYGISIELAEKSIKAYNDFILRAPVKIELGELGFRTLGRIDSGQYSNAPTIKDVTSQNESVRHTYKTYDDHASVYGCVEKQYLDTTYFKFFYCREAAPTVVLVAPLF